MAAIMPIFLGLANAVDNEEMALERRILRDTSNPFSLPESQFLSLFRLSKDIVRYLCVSLQEPLQRQRSHGLTVEVQVLAALRFFAVGSYQRGIGQELLLSISQPAVSRAIKNVSEAIRTLLGEEWVKFPDTLEKRQKLKMRFREAHGMKGVIGCIDCTHVALVRPKDHEEAYVNHKGFHSINVQVICSYEMKILSISARYPGSVHDAFIWRNSIVRREMKQRCDLGDHSSWILACFRCKAECGGKKEKIENTIDVEEGLGEETGETLGCSSHPSDITDGSGEEENSFGEEACWAWLWGRGEDPVEPSPPEDIGRGFRAPPNTSEELCQEEQKRPPLVFGDDGHRLLDENIPPQYLTVSLKDV